MFEIFSLFLEKTIILFDGEWKHTYYTVMNFATSSYDRIYNIKIPIVKYKLGFKFRCISL